MPISNAEKQERFRKKENLKRNADRIFQLWVTSPTRWNKTPLRTEQEVREDLDKIVELSSAWTEEDYRYAEVKLEQYRADLDFSVDQISNDINGDWTSHSIAFMRTPDPANFHAEMKEANEKARTLAGHLISALKLSNSNDADKTAALMEAVRFVGRSLVINREIRRSEATAMCLASIGPQYDRPAWFPEQLADTIGQHIDKSLAHEVGQHLRAR